MAIKAQLDSDARTISLEFGDLQAMQGFLDRAKERGDFIVKLDRRLEPDPDDTLRFVLKASDRLQKLEATVGQVFFSGSEGLWGTVCKVTDWGSEPPPGPKAAKAPAERKPAAQRPAAKKPSADRQAEPPPARRKAGPRRQTAQPQAPGHPPKHQVATEPAGSPKGAPPPRRRGAAAPPAAAKAAPAEGRATGPVRSLDAGSKPAPEGAPRTLGPVAVPEAKAAGQGAAPSTSETAGRSPVFDIRQMNVTQKMRLATRAQRQERQILLRDHSPQVMMGLLANPRLEDKEVLEIVKSSYAAAGVLQRIAADRKWAGNYEVQLALVRNPKTPFPLAARLVETLRIPDLQVLAKSSKTRDDVKKLALRVYLKRSKSR